MITFSPVKNTPRDKMYRILADHQPTGYVLQWTQDGGATVVAPIGPNLPIIQRSLPAAIAETRRRFMRTVCRHCVTVGTPQPQGY